MTKWRDLVNNLPISLIFNEYLCISKFSNMVKYIEMIILKIRNSVSSSYCCLLQERLSD